MPLLGRVQVYVGFRFDDRGLRAQGSGFDVCSSNQSIRRCRDNASIASDLFSYHRDTQVVFPTLLRKQGCTLFQMTTVLLPKKAYYGSKSHYVAWSRDRSHLFPLHRL